ncbi:arginine repressor [Thermus filiformis]|uniref:Arginine repressor n=1 Tax=Thermus filiformis TaxID=276 RepID=A0A0A2WMM0_THEFI|nr:arginine repressor [Thermus filiformis]KGQ21043.1 arginine repressor [Thermus filiformis]
MNKAERHRAIQEIVSKEEISTQKELVDKLRERGFNVTQATVSRDIAELHLVRVALGKGRHKYALADLELPEDVLEVLRKRFKEFVRDVDRGGNILVIKTAEGHASGIALLIDRLKRDEIVGTLAGEDTILVVARSEEGARALEEEFGGFLA